ALTNAAPVARPLRAGRIASAHRALACNRRVSRSRPRLPLVPLADDLARFWRQFRRAVSSGGRDNLVESLGGSLPCEGFAGSLVEVDGDVVEGGLVVAGEVDAFGQEATDEPVPVLVGAALPG